MNHWPGVFTTSISALALFALTGLSTSASGNDADGLPEIPDGFQVSVYAREPLVRNPCAMAFDVRGRLFVGQGPQYRSPTPETGTDQVTLLIDSNGDLIADTAKTFAEGFNSIQGLAWYGDQLWIANAPDLTVVRDLDGDDQADEYRRIYGGLGNIEHALHGLVFAPDGRLYMTKGNSKGYLDQDSPEKFVAPAPFADLWGVDPPENTPTSPETDIFTRDTYQHGYHHPSDDWGTEGGVLRCRPDGSQLEVYCRGMRNTWDMNFDADFNWVGTDQDQDGGDRILNPFSGANFGWGHAWSPHWTGEDHLPTNPISGPLFHGSGTGVVFGAASRFPEPYRNVFFCADWLNRTIFTYRPKWEGSTMRNMEPPSVFAKAPQGRSSGSSVGILFDPTDIEFGPDGAMWVLSWGHGYGATIKDGQQVDEGRVYRISCGSPVINSQASKHARSYTTWTVAELIKDLRHESLPVRRSNAQAELIRRDGIVRDDLVAELKKEDLPAGASTWLIWTLGQIAPGDTTIDNLLEQLAASTNPASAQRIQAIRVLGDRARLQNQTLPETVRIALNDADPRIRFAAVQAIHEREDKTFATELWNLLSHETDRTTFYAARVASGRLMDETQLRAKLSSRSVGQRKAALLTLLETASLTGDDVLPFRLDSDATIAGIASSFVSKVGTSESPVLRIESTEEKPTADLKIRIVTGRVPAGLHVRYTINGTEPTDTTGVKYGGPFSITKGAVVSAALFKGRERMGPVIREYSLERPIETDTDSVGRVYPVDVSRIVVAGELPYRASSLSSDHRVYENRQYLWTEIPDELVGHRFIQPRNGDSDVGSTGDTLLSFTVEEPTDVYVAHDQRITQKPDWLAAYKPTELTVSSQDTIYDLFVQRQLAGEVTLGGNTRDGVASGRSQYICIIKPAPLRTLDAATTVEQSLAQLESASYLRGARLYFNQVGCSKCHRIGNRGNAFAPNLTKMGSRATAKAIAESILKPSAVITEGFHTVVIVTDEGRSHSGFIKQESGLNVELVLANGNVVSIPRSSIEARRRQQVSVMPDQLAMQLDAQQVADLIRFIKDESDKPNQTDHAAADSDTGQPAPLEKSPVAREFTPLDVNAPVTIQDDGDALKVRFDGKDLATYVYHHDKVLRPFFAHVKAPSGTQVTRNFPPLPDDRSDHDTMHPGLWMAFGDISGEDFWRNKGRVVHKRFIEPPTGGPGVAQFVQRKSYQRGDGSIVCNEEFRCTVRVLPEGYLLEWDSTFSAPAGGEFYFGDQEEMGLGIRVATPLSELAGGRILDSKRRRGAKAIWSRASDWCDYSGKVGDESLGITILCHPDNFRNSWMHARNYGLIAANPFGRKAMQKGPASRIAVKDGESLRIRYGIFLHGDVRKLDDIHTSYVNFANRISNSNGSKE